MKTSKIEKSIEIRDAKIDFVSLVRKAANKRRFLITKADDGERTTFEALGRIVKRDDETHYVTGVVYEPLKKDTDDNFMTENEIRKAAYDFVQRGGQVDLQHSFEAANGATVVESYIAPCDMEVGGEQIAKGTWLMTVEVQNDDVWEAVQKGDLTGFSMGGSGVYSTIDVEIADVTSMGKEKKSIFKRVTEFFGPNENSKQEEQELKKEEVQELIDAALAKSDESTPLTAETVQEMIAKAIADASKPASEPEPLTKEAVQELIAKALKPDEPEKPEALTVEKAKELIGKAIEPLLTARGLPNQLNGENTVQKSEKHYLAGLL